jgi:hypothetical protein
VERCHNVALICPFTHCRPHCWKPLTTKLGSAEVSSLQLCSGSFWLSPVWSTQRQIDKPPFCQWPRSERSSACVTSHSKKKLRAYSRLWTTGLVWWKVGSYIEEWCYCTHFL